MKEDSLEIIDYGEGEDIGIGPARQFPCDVSPDDDDELDEQPWQKKVQPRIL